MMITVVRSLVGTTVELPGPQFIRPWAMVELQELSDEMREKLKALVQSRVVQVGHVVDGQPVSDLRLDKPNLVEPTIGKAVI